MPHAATRLWIERLPYQARMARRIGWYSHGYHMLLRDLEGPIVAADVASWVLEPAAPLPSGADREAADAFSPGASQVSRDAR